MHLLHSPVFWTWFLSLASILLMLVRPWRIPEVVWICGGAIVLVFAGLMPARSAVSAIGKGTDVYLFLTGMMLLAELARHEGVFDWIADVAVRRSKSSASRLFILIYLTGVVVTALLSNDATAVVLTPAVLAAVRRAEVDAKPYLLACAMIANAASLVLPISNPANLVVYGQHIPALGPWLKLFLLPSVVSIVVTYLCLRVLSRKTLGGEIHRPSDKVALRAEGRMALAGLVLASVVLLAASAFGLDLGAPTCIAAAVALVMVGFKDKGIYSCALKEISWSVLPLVAGLFILVEALDQAGMMQLARHGLEMLLGFPRVAGALGASFGVAVLSNLMNNLPVGLMSGAALAQMPAARPLSHAILIGVDLGPNLSVTGSLATILWLIALRRDKVQITAGEFFKAGLVAMPPALALSVLLQLALR